MGQDASTQGSESRADDRERVPEGRSANSELLREAGISERNSQVSRELSPTDNRAACALASPGGKV